MVQAGFPHPDPILNELDFLSYICQALYLQLTAAGIAIEPPPEHVGAEWVLEMARSGPVVSAAEQWNPDEDGESEDELFDLDMQTAGATMEIVT